MTDDDVKLAFLKGMFAGLILGVLACTVLIITAPI